LCCFQPHLRLYVLVTNISSAQRPVRMSSAVDWSADQAHVVATNHWSLEARVLPHHRADRHCGVDFFDSTQELLRAQTCSHCLTRPRRARPYSNAARHSCIKRPRPWICITMSMLNAASTTDRHVTNLPLYSPYAAVGSQQCDSKLW
jgi:hypothetical protein